MENTQLPPLVVVCGLPRSGTTYISALIRKAFPMCVAYPDEAHFLGCPSLMEALVEIMDKFYEKMLVESYENGYSPFGSKLEFIDNWFGLFLASINSINSRNTFEANTIGDKYKQEQKNYLFSTLYQLNKSPLILKKPLAEASFIQINKLFIRKVIYVYCLRDICDVFTSNIEKLRWFDAAEMIKVAKQSYSAVKVLELDEVNTLIPVNPSMLCNKTYMDKFFESISNEVSLEATYSEIEALGEKTNINDANHIAQKYGYVWSQSMIEQIDGGNECLKLYQNGMRFHNQFYYSNAD